MDLTFPEYQDAPDFPPEGAEDADHKGAHEESTAAQGG